jgi:methionyl-tRNA formyltransferase
MRVAFIGNDPWSVPPLRALAEADDVDVALVVTNPPRPAGRGSRLTPTAVADVARSLDLPLLEVEGVRAGEGFEALERLEPHALVVVAYWQILSPEVLDIPTLGAVNVHFSMLPRWRGAAPVQRTILEGDEVTGVTVMLMDEGMDTGPILAAAETPIEPDEDAGSLGTRLSELGGDLLVSTLRALGDGSIEPRSQDHTAATYAPKPTPAERTIDWSAGADAVVRRIRAFSPEPGAVTTFRHRPLKVLAGRRVDAPGRILADSHLPRWGAIWSHEGRVVVGSGTGAVELLEVVPAGRRRMDATDWARGVRLEADDSFA